MIDNLYLLQTWILRGQLSSFYGSLKAGYLWYFFLNWVAICKRPRTRHTPMYNLSWTYWNRPCDEAYRTYVMMEIIYFVLLFKNTRQEMQKQLYRWKSTRQILCHPNIPILVLWVSNQLFNPMLEVFWKLRQF